MKWQTYPLLEWIKQNSQDWENELILNWEDTYPRSEPTDVLIFTTENEFSYGDINMAGVVGQRDHYAGQTWLEALLKPQYKEGKMRNNIERFDANGVYYFDEERKDIHFDTVDGRNWYSNGGGNHRTVIGKFVFAMAEALTGQPQMLRNVHLARYTVDWSTYELYCKLQSIVVTNALGIHIKVERHSMYRVNGHENNHEYFEPIFFVMDNRFRDGNNNHLCGHLSSDEFCRYAEWIIDTRGQLLLRDKASYWWQLFFGKPQDSLIYPGSKPSQRTSSKRFAEQRRHFWQATKVPSLEK